MSRNKSNKSFRLIKIFNALSITGTEYLSFILMHFEGIYNGTLRIIYYKNCIKLTMNLEQKLFYPLSVFIPMLSSII